MSGEDMMFFLIVWSLIGGLLFFGYVVLVFRTGLAYSARNPDGTLKDKIPRSGRLAMGSFLVLIIAFLVCANFIGLPGQIDRLRFWTLFMLNYALYAILFLYDTFFIDAFVLGIWRPAFLRLPEEMGRQSMKRHILASIPVGLLAGVILAALSTWISRGLRSI